MTSSPESKSNDGHQSAYDTLLYMYDESRADGVKYSKWIKEAKSYLESLLEDPASCDDPLYVEGLVERANKMLSDKKPPFPQKTNT